MWLQPGSLGQQPPPALLVDEGLADVEEDGFQSHDSTSARSAAVVIFSSRGVAVDDADPAAAGLDKRCTVGRVDRAVAAVGRPERASR